MFPTVGKGVIDMIFISPSGKYPPCGLFSSEHYMAISVCAVIIILALMVTGRTSLNRTRGMIRKVAVLVSFLEVMKIIFNLFTGNTAVSNWMPLYFCSLFILALWMTGFGSPKMEHSGKALMFGIGVICGAAYLFAPTTSLGRYPVFHFLSVYSLGFHSLMIYFGLLIVFTGYYKPEIRDVTFYLFFCSIFIVIVYLVDTVFSCNFMYILTPTDISVLTHIYNVSPHLYRVLLLSAHLLFYFLHYFFYAFVNLLRAVQKGLWRLISQAS
jgi:uncharacterized membrane protein YwaF